MQKLVYVSNSRDYTEQGNINENKYFTQINGLLEQGWKVAQVIPNVTEILSSQKPKQNETFAALVVLEKADEQEVKPI